MRKLLNARRMRERYDICERTLHRWERQPGLDLPQPLLINRRKYFCEDQLIEWERRRARPRADDTSTPDAACRRSRGPPETDRA